MKFHHAWTEICSTERVRNSMQENMFFLNNVCLLVEKTITFLNRIFKFIFAEKIKISPRHMIEL